MLEVKYETFKCWTRTWAAKRAAHDDARKGGGELRTVMRGKAVAWSKHGGGRPARDQGVAAAAA